MDNITPFQSENPLSKNKFLKKLTGGTIGAVIFAVLLSPIVGIAAATAYHAATIGTPDNLIINLGLIVAIAFGLIGLRVIFLLWYVPAYIRTYRYDCSEQFITIKKGVVIPKEIHVQYGKIQDVYVDQDLLDRVFGIFDVHIASATVTSGMEAHIDGVDQETATRVKEFILSKISGASSPSTVSTTAFPSAAAPEAVPSTNNPQSSAFSEEISEQRYPVSAKYFLVMLFQGVLSGLILPLLVLAGVLFRMSYGEALILIFWSLLFLSVFIVPQYIYFLLWKRHYAFRFTPDFIYYRTGVIAVSESHLAYTTIQDVTIDRSFTEKIFGMARVKIENAAQGARAISFVGLSASDADHIAEVLRAKLVSRTSVMHGL